jgi:hypothetical protein
MSEAERLMARVESLMTRLEAVLGPPVQELDWAQARAFRWQRGEGRRGASAVVMVGVERVPLQTGVERDRSEGEPTPWNRYRVALAELILVTSWGERLGLHFRGDTALMRCMCEYLAWPSGRADRVSIEVVGLR